MAPAPLSVGNRVMRNRRQRASSRRTGSSCGRKGRSPVEVGRYRQSGTPADQHERGGRGGTPPPLTGRRPCPRDRVQGQPPRMSQPPSCPVGRRPPAHRCSGVVALPPRPRSKALTIVDRTPDEGAPRLTGAGDAPWRTRCKGANLARRRHRNAARRATREHAQLPVVVVRGRIAIRAGAGLGEKAPASGSARTCRCAGLDLPDSVAYSSRRTSTAARRSRVGTASETHRGERPEVAD